MNGFDSRPKSMTLRVSHQDAHAPWHLRLLRDSFSFEALFALLCFSGSYKGTEFMHPIQSRGDITLALMIACALCGTLSLVLRPAGDRAKLGGDAGKFLLACGVLLFYITLSYFSYEPGPDATRKLQRVLVFDSFFVIMPMLCIATPERLQRFLRIYVTFAAATALASLLSARAGPHLGTFGTENYHALGRYAGEGLVICAAHITMRKDARYWYVMVAALLGIAVVLSGARHAILSALLSLLYIVVMVSRRKGQLSVAQRAFVGILVTSVLAWGIKALFFEELSTERVQARMLEALSQVQETEPSSDSRVRLWLLGWDMFGENPFFGIGFGGYYVSTVFSTWRHAHNIALEFLSELGVVGFALGFAVLRIPTLAALRQSIAAHSEYLALGALFVFHFAAAQVSGDLATNRILFTSAGLMLMTSNFRRAVNPQDARKPTAPDTEGHEKPQL
jgi:O-antigen ligase